MVRNVSSLLRGFAFCALFALTIFNGRAAMTGTFVSERPLPDRVFLQEVSHQFPAKTALTSVAVVDGRVFAGGREGLFELVEGMLQPVTDLKVPIQKLVVVDKILWAIGADAIYRLDRVSWTKLASAGVVAIAPFAGGVVAATAKELLIIKNDSTVAASTNSANSAPFPIERISLFNDSLYIQGGKRLSFFDGTTFGGKDLYDFSADLGWDWGALPGTEVRDMLADGSSLYLATERGVGALRGMTLHAIRGADGLPFEDTTCLAKGFTNDLWIGTTRGVIRKLADSEFHYFAGKRWLPADRVHSVAAGERSVWIATEGGLAEIAYVPMTLEAKANFYEKHLVEWGQKRLGLVHKLEWDEKEGEYVREAGDNDGGYSSDYLAAQSYRYAVTQNSTARAEAVNTFKAIRWLEQMTGIPGFPARAVWVKNEKGHKATGGSGGYPAEWHDVPGTPFEWKGDTSSDELCAHFYAIDLFLSLAAQGIEVEQAKAHLTRIAAHLIQNRWQLIDFDGKPTRWGRWDPDYFATEEGRFDQGLQSLELLAFMKTAAHVSGEERYRAAYDQLIHLGYPQKTLRQRAVFPPDSVLHFEDQLAFWSYWNLLRRETNSALRSVYRRSFERTWEILRVEQQPWFNFVYGALTGNPCEPENALRHLREWPLDLVIYSYQNSHRTDLETPRNYKSLKAGTRPFSPREREPMRWDGWTMQADGGTDGRDVVEPSGWLLAYWLGRYHGFIAAPEVQISPEVSVPVHRGSRKGARPYDGPARPDSP